MLSLLFRYVRVLFFVLVALVAAAAFSIVTGAPLLVSLLACLSASLFLSSVLPSGVLAAAPVPFLGVQSTDEERAVYTRLAAEMAEIGPEAFATRGSLRLEVAGGAKNRYRFSVLQDEGTRFASERRLARTDAFQVDRVGVFLSKVWKPGELSDADKLQVVRDGGTFGECSKTLSAWPNPWIFQGLDEVEAARALLNAGVLSVEIDKVKWLEQFDAMSSRFVDTAQQGPVGTDPWADAWRTNEVLTRMVPTFRFNGGSSNIVELSVDCAVDFSGAPWTSSGETPVEDVETETRIVLIFDGWYLANAGEFLARSRP